MFQHILELDQRLFYFINHDLTNPVFDVLMPVLRNPITWIPLYIFLAFFFIRKFRMAGFIALLFLAANFGLADFVSAGIIKKQVHRLRPCNVESLAFRVTERVPCGSGLSFPSSHATNHFAIAVFLSIILRHTWKHVVWLSQLWAVLICFAQVYVGVHFPVDVLGGAILGSLIGSLFALLLKRTVPVFR